MAGDIPFSCFTFNFKSILVDEIALSGLEGIGLDYLWKRMEKRLGCSLTTKIKTMFWKFIVSTKCITVYNNKTPVPVLEVLDRFSIVDEDTGHIGEPPDYIDGPYEYCPVKNEYGSAPNFNSRKVIKEEILEQKSYEEIFEQYGNTVVMVATLEKRWQALAPHKPMSLLSQLTSVHYCILELVGRSRENGQMTVGKSNLNKIVSESKFLFYNRKYLQDIDLIRLQCITQVVATKGIKSLLLRLKRFHEPMIRSQPRIGKIHDMTTYLLNKPDYTEKIEVMMRKGLLSSQQSKRLQKTVNVFQFFPQDKERCRKKSMALVSQSDESSHSDDESEEPKLETQYKVGISLLRQAYDTFINAGLKGLTQTEMAHLLGIEFYTSRSICRIFKSKNMVQEFLEDKGKQRTARFIAVAATNKVNFKYTQEKKELMDFLKKNRKRCISEKLKEVPEKKAKLDGGNDEDIDKKIINVKVLDGLEGLSIERIDNSKKKPTLRQLRFATGILKVVKDRRYVTGYQTLSSFVHKETGEVPMDTKSLKLIIQKLMNDDQLKVFKFKISYKDKVKYSLFICPPSVKETDPFVKAYYDELCLKAKINYKNPATKSCSAVTRPLSNYTYPRYLKIQKLHEHIFKIVYCQDNKSCFAPGFTSLHDMIPDMTVELALGNISYIEGKNNIASLKISTLEQRVRDAPDSLRHNILYSKHLHNSIRGSLKMLAVMGLVQCIKNPSACLGEGIFHASFVFYVNRHAKILDTSGKWPRDKQNAAAIERYYHFKTMDDVYKYWNDVETLSMNTTIAVEKRERYRFIYPMCDESRVNELDDGRRYGDGLGPCGFDSSFYMEIPRLWHTFSSRTNKLKIAKIMKSKIKFVKASKTAQKEEKKKSLKAMKGRRPRKSKTKSTPIPKPVLNAALTKRPRNESAVKWTEFDDRILTMLKIAITVMGQVPGCIKVRNTVANALLSFNDPCKTASMCHRRYFQIENNPELAHEKLCLLNELRRRRDLIAKYEGLFRVIKLRQYANLPKFIKESKLPMLELLWIIYQISKSKPYMNRTPCIASNLKEFHKNYVITASVAMKVHSLYQTPLASGPKLATLKEAVLLATMLTMNEAKFKEVCNRIYELFKDFDEKDLRGAIEELRKSGAIAARDKLFNNILNKVHIHEIVQSCYKISFSYNRRWSNRMSSAFGDGIVNLISDELPQNGLKGTSDVNCFLFEMYACGQLDIVTVTIPIIIGSTGTIIQEEKINIIDMESKYKLKSGLVGVKKLSHSKPTLEMYKICNVEENFEEYGRNIVTMISKHEVQTEDQLIEYLEAKEDGYIFSELKDLSKMDRKELYQKLIQLEKDTIIKRVGYYENRIVLTKYATPWLFEIGENKYILPTPWLDFDGKVQPNIFLQWSSVILSKIFECPGSTIEFLSNIFEYITYRGVQDICQFLNECHCIYLKCHFKKDIDLFSDDDEVPSEFVEFQPYEAPQNIYAFPLKDSLTKFSYVKRQILNKKQL